ncbi:MAG: lysine--tRNA ligase [Patescibacteria group bacterium]|nr:lysine--tRNA ligase [Patescibacteria group bacterium]
MNMFWADKLLENVKGKQIINDSWTPSGMVHAGSIKGPVLHDVIYRVAKEKNPKTEFIFGIDDMDPVDGLPKELLKTHEKYFGYPLFLVPGPNNKGTFADYFMDKMLDVFKKLNIAGKIYRVEKLYKEGKFNEWIKKALDNADKIRKIYKEVSGSQKPEDWFPFQVICPNCQKLGTTKVIGWDGEKVEFICEENMVNWAKGCGERGEMSPFNGNGKLVWRVEWAAKWALFNITIEAAGKDHASKGGSYDVSGKICEEVFGKKMPMKIPYEHLLSGGKKMSSSKGIGLSSDDLFQVMPPELIRFSIIKTPPNQAVEFTVYNTDLIPKIYDSYQKASDEYFSSRGRSASGGNNTNEELVKAFELSQIEKPIHPPRIRFSVLAQWVQMPNMEDEIKKEGLGKWARYAKVWVEKYAPESEKFLVQQKIPDAVKNLSQKQKEFLRKISSELDKKWDAEDFQKNIYGWSKEIELPSKDAFSSIYISLLGKDHGPKAAWLILSLAKDFVKKRFAETYSNDTYYYTNNKRESGFQKLNNPEIFLIDNEVKDKFPSISVGVAIIKGVEIKKINENLEKEKKDLSKSLGGLTTEAINEYLEVLSYRRLYKETGIDWHSRRPSPEALLRRVALKKGLYNVNTCVDAYNLIVMKNHVSVGAFDLDKIEFPTSLRFAKEGEEILLLGEETQTKYRKGEIAYFDQKGGFNLDFNYRDAQRTLVQLSTKNLYINVDGVYDISPKKVEEVLREACGKIIKYCGGEIELFGIVY